MTQRLQFLILLIVIIIILNYFTSFVYSSLLYTFFSIAFILSYIFYPPVLDRMLLYWLSFGGTLGKILNPLILSIIYFVIVLPIGLLARLFAGNIMGYLKSKDSYWIELDKKDYKDYFDKQY